MRVGSSRTQADSYKMLLDIKSGLEVSFSFTGDRMFQSISVSQALFEILIYGENRFGGTILCSFDIIQKPTAECQHSFLQVNHHL